MLPLLLQDLQLQDHLLALTHPPRRSQRRCTLPQLLLPLLLQSRPVGVSTRVKTLHPVTCFPSREGRCSFLLEVSLLVQVLTVRRKYRLAERSVI
jgi:hypothetical protein